ncbi:type II secretion system protein GspL [Pseudomonas sp. UFMG81]|uniref:type II secretion system protein GspL n=1 Tax=Pseudomonas sp. UFMG81 TaxID=2745936 RepID=UPI00188F9597|nr:type II secretion system protein GspL [Pseudomonas sp. UFMG81]
MSGQLRVALPPVQALATSATVDYLLIDRQGQVEASGVAMPGDLAKLGKGRALIALLDPQDAVQTSIQLPPLPVARLGDAVRCAAQALVLGDSAQLYIAHGPRAVDGEVEVAWIGQPALHTLSAWSQQAGIRWRAVHPWPEPGAQVASLPAWGLQGGLHKGPASTAGWGRAAACIGIAILVWVAGLNLYAGQLAAEGQQLRQRMHAQVRQAFPQLPAIINPLQQVRQQLQAGAGQPGQGSGFEHLVQAAGAAMPFLAGAVQGLDYHDASLVLELAEDAQPAPADSWQAALGNQGVEAQARGQRWTLRALAQPAGEELANAH